MGISSAGPTIGITVVSSSRLGPAFCPKTALHLMIRVRASERGIRKRLLVGLIESGSATRIEETSSDRSVPDTQQKEQID